MPVCWVCSCCDVRQPTLVHCVVGIKAYRLPTLLQAEIHSVHRLLLHHTVTPMPSATPQPRVLVIDDSVDNADLLCTLLATMGCVTSAAYSGAQGLVAIAQFKPHLAFIDLEMPGMGGCDVVKHLRASHVHHAIRLVCLTGRGQASDRRLCMDAGFDDFFSKPVSLQSLTSVVAAVASELGAETPGDAPPQQA